MKRDFRRRLRQLFGRRRSGTDGVALFELNSMCSSHLAYAYLAGSKLFENATLVGFSQYLSIKWLTQLKFCVRATLGLSEFGVYRSFGVSKFILIKLTKSQKQWVLDFVDSFDFESLSKTDLEELRIEQCHIGDLIYDQYLNSQKEPTVDVVSENFRETFIKALGVYKYWSDYFANNVVKGVSVSHCVYSLAIPLRVAVSRGVPVFQVSLTHFYRLSVEKPFAYRDFVSYREEFSKLDDIAQEEGLALAKQQIERRFSGEVGVDMHYSKKSAFGGIKKERVLECSDRPKVLISPHCFFDSPHPLGNNVFPDFYEWLMYLGEYANQSGYDWYIKVHPDFLAETKSVIDQIVDRFPIIKVIPADTSHLQLVEEGVNCVLTVYGTVGIEYAALNVPVINATVWNFNSAYDFNYHASSVADYRRLLDEVPRKAFSVKIEDVYECYYMRFIYAKSVFFPEVVEALKEREYKFQFTEGFYEVWLNGFDMERHLDIVKGVDEFIESGDYKASPAHRSGNEYGLRDVACESTRLAG